MYRAVNRHIVEITDQPWQRLTGAIWPVGFYFWNERGTDVFGPYATLKDCEKALTSYQLMQW